MSITASDIFGFTQEEVRKLEVEQWKHLKGGVVYIRSFGHADHTKFKDLCNGASMASLLGIGDVKEQVQNVNDMLLVSSLCDANGKLLFDDNDETYEKIGEIQKQEEVFEFLVNEIDKLNGLRPKHEDGKPLSDAETIKLLEDSIKKK